MAELKDPSMLRKDDTIMYSVETIEVKDTKGKGTGAFEEKVVEHRFPWDRNNRFSAPKFQKMEKRGFTYERPALDTGVALAEPRKVEESVIAVASQFICPECKKTFKNNLGLMGHRRSHKAVSNALS